MSDHMWEDKVGWTPHCRPQDLTVMCTTVTGEIHLFFWKVGRLLISCDNLVPVHPVYTQPLCFTKHFYWPVHALFPGVIQIFPYLGKIKADSAPVLVGVSLAPCLSPGLASKEVIQGTCSKITPLTKCIIQTVTDTERLGYVVSCQVKQPFHGSS